MFYNERHSLDWKEIQLLEEMFVSQINQCSRADKQVCVRVEYPYHWHFAEKTIDTVLSLWSKICVKMVHHCSSIIPDKSFSFFPDKSHCISRLGWHMGRKLTACGQIYLPTCHLQIVLCSTLSSLIFPLVSEWKSPCRVCRLMVTRDLHQAKLTFLLLCWKKSFLCSTSTRGSLDKRWSR